MDLSSSNNNLVNCDHLKTIKLFGEVIKMKVSYCISSVSEPMTTVIRLIVITLCVNHVLGVDHLSSNYNRKQSNRIINTKYGRARGVHVNLPHNLQPIEMFLGIPYASPPVGRLRLMPPVTPVPWNEDRDFNSYGPVCPQQLPNLSNETEALTRMTSYRYNNLKRLLPLLKNQSEDCLYLNIYLPAKASSTSTASTLSPPSPYPVIVFIHGESYEYNSGSAYDGSILASFGDTIVITINFRLGVLGFFPSLDGTTRGNFGLLDQVAALHWIQENIESFGGSPNNVTIMGHDYGASFVNLLMISPMAKGLFQRAIMSSGSALSPFSMATDSLRYSKLLSERVGCPVDHTSAKNTLMLNCLRKKSLDEIMSITFDAPKHLTIFGPTVDGTVIPADPLLMMTDDTSLFGSYELLTGVTRVEYYHSFNDHDVHHGIEPSRRDRIIRTLVRNQYDYHLQEIYLTISNEYTNWEKPTSHPFNIIDSLTDLLSDSLVVAPVIKVATLHSRRPAKTYFYAFTYSTEDGDFPSRLGCVSGQDLNYLFGAPLITGHKLSHFSSKYTRSEIALAQTLITNWVSFVKFGDPNMRDDETDALVKGNQSVKEPKVSSNSRGSKVTWPIYEEHQQQYYVYDITIKPKLRDHYHAHRMSYWLNLIPKLHVPGSSANQDYHLLHNHHDLSTYDGTVRANRLPSLLSSPSQSSSNIISSPPPVNLGESGSLSSSYPNSSITHSHHGLLDVNSDGVSSSSSSSFSGSHRSSSAYETQNSAQSTFNSTVSFLGTHVTYTTALSVTIAIGCSLLILNVLVFVGFFYHRDHLKAKESKSNAKNSSNPNNQSNNNNQLQNKSSDDDHNGGWQLTGKETGRSMISYYPESNSFICPSETTLTTVTTPTIGLGGGGNNNIGNNITGEMQINSTDSPLPVHQWINSQQQQQQQQQSIACANYKGYQLHPYTPETIDILQTSHHPLNHHQHHHHVSLNNCTYTTTTINPNTVGNVEKNLTNLMDTSSLVITDDNQSKSKLMPSETGI